MYVGSYKPPSSHFLERSFISIGELVFIGVAVLIGITATLVILIFNIVLRKNRYDSDEKCIEGYLCNKYLFHYDLNYMHGTYPQLKFATLHCVATYKHACNYGVFL